MILRLACLLVIASQVLLVHLFLQPTGPRAILFAFVGNPLLAVALILGLLWWWRHRQEIRHANRARDRAPRAVA